MKQMGLIFNSKRIFLYFILLVLGLSLIAFGILDFYGDQKVFETSMSDEDVIKRAKELGMVELKSTFTTEPNEDEETTTQTQTENGN